MNITRHRALGQRQSGATLIVALMFLVIVTILGVGMFLTSSSDEIVARNFRDREIALRAAESAINEAKLRINGMFDRDHPPTTAPDPLSVDTCDLATLPAGFSCDQAAYMSSSVDLFSGGTPPGANVGSYNPNNTTPNNVSPPYTLLEDEPENLAALSVQPRYLIVLMALENCTLAKVAGSDPPETRECFKIFGQGRGRLASTRVNLIEMYLR